MGEYIGDIVDRQGIRIVELQRDLEAARLELADLRAEYEAYKGTFDGEATRLLKLYMPLVEVVVKNRGNLGFMAGLLAGAGSKIGPLVIQDILGAIPALAPPEE